MSTNDQPTPPQEPGPGQPVPDHGAPGAQQPPPAYGPPAFGPPGGYGPPPGYPQQPGGYPVQLAPTYSQQPLGYPSQPAGYPQQAPFEPGATPGAGATTADAHGRARTFGIISIVAAAGVLLWQAVHVFAQIGIIASANYDAIGTLGLVGSVIEALLALAAIAFGAIGLAQRGGPKALPGIGLGAGISVLVSLILWSGIYPALAAVSF